jgi:hypothetical protein
MPRRIPVFGLLVAALIVITALYLSTKVESQLLKFVILFVGVFFVVSAFMGLGYEHRIGNQIIQQGYVDQYVAEHGVGNQETFKEFMRDLKSKGFSINPGVEKLLWEEIKKKTGYRHQTSV